MTFNSKQFESVISSYSIYKHYWIAYSGGLDSHVLLHALAQLPQKLSLRAIHVNHGWHKDAAQWAEHSVKSCAALGIICDVINLDVKPIRGKSLEALARDARYQAFAKVMKENDCLLTAHQQDDQAETLLLQLLRGAGVKGLASMPDVTSFADGYHVRPLLNFSRAELKTYADQEQLNWIEDDSNLNLKFDRNFIRHELMPHIQQRWPQAAATLARTAQHCAEATELLDELAAKDLEYCQEKNNYHKLSIKNILQLNPARQRNLLRYWLQQLNFPVPSSVQLAHIQNDILQSSVDAEPIVCWDEVEIRRYRNDLFAFKSSLSLQLPENISWDLMRPLELINIGTLSATEKLGQGINRAALRYKKITARFRGRGQRFHPVGRQGSHPLKKLFQEWDIPPWERDRTPLIFCEDELVAVAGYAVSEKFAAKQNELGWVINWQRV